MSSETIEGQGGPVRRINRDKQARGRSRATDSTNVSFQRLWTENRRLWYHVAFSITQDSDVVDEVVQTAFQKMLGCDRRWASGRHSVNYFKKAVSHCSMDYLKQRSRDRSLCRRLSREPAICDPDPESLLIEKEAQADRQAWVAAILECWGRIPLAQQCVLHEVVLHGVPLREYSRRTKLPVSTAHSRLVRGLGSLRTALFQRGITHSPLPSRLT